MCTSSNFQWHESPPFVHCLYLTVQKLQRKKCSNDLLSLVLYIQIRHHVFSLLFSYQASVSEVNLFPNAALLSVYIYKIGKLCCVFPLLSRDILYITTWWQYCIWNITNPNTGFVFQRTMPPKYLAAHGGMCSIVMCTLVPNLLPPPVMLLFWH